MARTRRRTVAALVCAVLATTGCSLPLRDGGGGGGSAVAAGDSIERGVAWRDCADIPRDLVGRVAEGMTYQCATVKVPRHWGAQSATDPSGAPEVELLDIALIRVRAADQRDRIGSLVINPGGPGGSGVDSAVYLSFGAKSGGLSKEITRRFDIVGFDPRGVGRSSPVDCIEDRDLDAYFGADPDPVTQQAFDRLVQLNRRIAVSCARRYGAAGLATYSTEQAARDMDAVRVAVGDDKLTYLGYSYGTLLGATYAQLFPHRVRAFVLDGAVDPQAATVAASEGQARGFEQAFDNFAAWCGTAARTCPIAPDARAALTAAMDKARVSPVRGARGRTATAGWIFWAVVSSLYTRSGWEELATALDKLADGDPAKVFELADRYVERDSSGAYATMFDAFFTISCADDDERSSAAQARALQARWRTKYPLFGGALATGLLTCATWTGRPDPYPTGAAEGAPPILVVGTTGDPATPYEQTAKLARMLGVGRVLTWEGEGHTAYPSTACITTAVDSYLVDLRVPAEGLRCPAR